MIIKGSFDPNSGRPYVDGLLFIPTLNKSLPIDFLVDTGADNTTLNPGDGKKMGIDYNSLNYTSQAYAVGCRYKEAQFQAIVVFTAESGELIAYQVDLSITPYKKSLEMLPSLLGTDVLRRWKIAWDFSQGILDFDVVSYDVLRR